MTKWEVRFVPFLEEFNADLERYNLVLVCGFFLLLSVKLD